MALAGWSVRSALQSQSCVPAASAAALPGEIMQSDVTPLARSGSLAAGSVSGKLRELNQAYLDSVATCDVVRFRQLLADDFLCSGPDGVLLDKAQFLARTAAPRTLDELTADD